MTGEAGREGLDGRGGAAGLVLVLGVVVLSSGREERSSDRDRRRDLDMTVAVPPPKATATTTMMMINVSNMTGRDYRRPPFSTNAA